MIDDNTVKIWMIRFCVGVVIWAVASFITYNTKLGLGYMIAYLAVSIMMQSIRSTEVKPRKKGYEDL